MLRTQRATQKELTWKSWNVLGGLFGMLFPWIKNGSSVVCGSSSTSCSTITKAASKTRSNGASVRFPWTSSRNFFTNRSTSETANCKLAWLYPFWEKNWKKNTHVFRQNCVGKDIFLTPNAFNQFFRLIATKSPQASNEIEISSSCNFCINDRRSRMMVGSDAVKTVRGRWGGLKSRDPVDGFVEEGDATISSSQYRESDSDSDDMVNKQRCFRETKILDWKKTTTTIWNGFERRRPYDGQACWTRIERDSQSEKRRLCFRQSQSVLC